MPAIGDVEVLHLIEGIDFSEVEGDSPIPDRGPRFEPWCAHQAFQELSRFHRLRSAD